MLGKLIAGADKFDVPICLIWPLADALCQGQMETGECHIVERGAGYSVYEFMGRRWRIPDAFLGFAWALREKSRGFAGLLDPVSCSLVDKFTKELPSPELPKLTTGIEVGSYEDFVGALISLGWRLRLRKEQDI